MGCDFLVSGTHKWIFAPRGTGIIWAREATWTILRPIIPSFTDEVETAWMENRAPQGPTWASWVSPGGYHAFEHQWAMIEAFRFHHQIGRKRIAERIHALNEQCKEGLAKMRHVKLYTPRGSTLSAGLICFDVTECNLKRWSKDCSGTGSWRALHRTGLPTPASPRAW